MVSVNKKGANWAWRLRLDGWGGLLNWVPHPLELVLQEMRPLTLFFLRRVPTESPNFRWQGTPASAMVSDVYLFRGDTVKSP